MWTLFGWLVVGLLGCLAASTLFHGSVHVVVAAAQDALFIIMIPAWFVFVISVLARSWLLAAGAGVLILFHLSRLVPRVTKNRVPQWVHSSPQLSLLVANVFIENKTPEALAAVLLGVDADVMVIIEWNQIFVDAFDASVGSDRYAHRVLDPENVTDYAVGIVSKIPLLSGSGIVKAGCLEMWHAVVEVGRKSLTIVGMNPYAAVDPGGLERWEMQIDALIEYLPSIPAPFVIAGDLNTTTNRPRSKELMGKGLVDAHESIGQGLSPSFKLAADGVLAAPGAVVRLDHVLMCGDVRAVFADDLDSAGSDHLPFCVGLVVRQ